ncbi:MAG: hypothetical protein JJ975_02765 [Bacteroidia bacterium]|nr:hypothetical protein [Bacteroidia bacterium]
MSTVKHTASGQAAGYLFQPDRALYWLSNCEKGATVGVETADDVTVVNDKGETVIREQDKNSVQADGVPIKDRSNDLWNTLYIWVKALESGEFKTENVGLFFATNKPIPEDALVKKIAEADNSLVDDIISRLKTAGQDPPLGIAEKVKYVLSKENFVKELVPIIQLSDNNTPGNLDDKIINQLHLPTETAYEILNELKGWIHSAITTLWNEGKPGVLSREAFDNYLNQSRYIANSRKVRERVKRLVLDNIEETKKSGAKQGIFVKQIEAISDDEFLAIDAIDDYLCADVERTRLIVAGEITGADFDDFDDKCEERWKEVTRRNIRTDKINSILSDRTLTQEQKEQKLRDLGFEIYDQTCSGYNGVLAGYTTTESYLTKGTYHMMSDSLKLGWHPQWKEMFNPVTTDESK